MGDKRFKGGSFLLETPDAADIFTPEDYSEEQRMIAQTTRDFALEKVRPLAGKIDHHEFEHSVRLLREAGELGLLAAEIPEDYGGLDLDKISATLITENMVWGGSFAVTHGAHVGIGTLPIVFFGTPDQRRKYLPALATGERIAAYALTEPGSGSDALSARTTAKLTPDGKHYLLNGTKQWITNAGLADVFIVYAKIDGDKFSAFIVERGTPGFSIGPEEKKMGIEGSSTRSLIFEDAQVPAENLLGEAGRGHVIAFNILNIGRHKLAAGCVGSAKIALELAAGYSKMRTQFGRPLAAFTLIQEKLAEMAIRTFAAESAVYRTGGLIDEGLRALDPAAPDAMRQAAKAIEEYAIEASINKVLGSETLDFVADEALQIHGGYGYMEEYEVEHIYRDARINRIFEGTNEINRLLIPGTLLRRAMKGELPMMAALGRLQDDLLSAVGPVLDDAPLAQEKSILGRAKKIFLLVAGLGVQKFQQQLENEQELLAAVADLGIEIFAMESTLLRAEKALRGEGAAAAQPKLDLAVVYTHEAFERIGALGRKALAAIEEGDALRTQLSILKKLTRYEPVNTVALKRRVAARVIEAGKYVV